MTYTISRRSGAPVASDGWTDEYWAKVPALSVDQFHPESSDHHPVTEVKATHTQDAIHVFFRVRDRYVRCVHTELNSAVCRDSCAEFFVQPPDGAGYFNFEINCGGTMLLYYIEDPTPDPAKGDMKKRTEVTADLADLVTIRPSMPKLVDPEITDPVEWTLQYSIPVKLMEHYVGALGPLGGQEWRANFYKCADQTSHPHWASWAPIGEELNFHQPKRFAPIIFEA